MCLLLWRERAEQAEGGSGQKATVGPQWIAVVGVRERGEDACVVGVGEGVGCVPMKRIVM